MSYSLVQFLPLSRNPPTRKEGHLHIYPSPRHITCIHSYFRKLWETFQVCFHTESVHTVGTKLHIMSQRETVLGPAFQFKYNRGSSSSSFFFFFKSPLSEFGGGARLLLHCSFLLLKNIFKISTADQHPVKCHIKSLLQILPMSRTPLKHFPFTRQWRIRFALNSVSFT